MIFEKFESALNGCPPVRVAVAGAAGTEIFSALKAAEEKGLIHPVLVGNEAEARCAAEAAGLAHSAYIPATDEKDAARAAVAAVADGRADILMKGKSSTSALLSAVLAEKTVFSFEGRLLSHAAVIEGPNGRLLGITDGGMVLHPNVDEKAQIICSAVELFCALGVERPKVAVLAAIEQENPKIPESIDAGELSRRCDRGRFKDCVVEGPMALDLAVNPMACKLKGYEGKIQGNADILVVHDVSSGNYLAKALMQLGGWHGAGLVVGARRPIVLLSRSDSAKEKFDSIILALTMYRARPQGERS